MNWQDLYSAFFSDGNTGYLVGDAGTVLKTTDGGNSFLSLSSGTTKAMLSVYFYGSDTGYIAGQDGIILKTINEGTSWGEIPSASKNHLYSVFFADDSNGYAVGAQGTILKTTNGGTVFIDELKDQNLSATIYPNPATTAIAISGNYSEIQIVDVSGRVVLKKQSEEIKNKTKIDVSHFQTGVYFFVGQTIDKQKTIQKFIKN